MQFYIDGIYKSVASGHSMSDDKIKVTLISQGVDSGIDFELTDESTEIPDIPAKKARSASIEFVVNEYTKTVDVPLNKKELARREILIDEIGALEKEISEQKRGKFDSGCDFKAYTIEDGILKGFKSTHKNYYKAVFHSQTPEDFHRRLTFLQQCTRQGEAIRKENTVNDGVTTFSANNAVFGRQPIQVLRIGDQFHTKIVIDSLQIDYTDAPWDMNPEGMGMQFMIADIKMTIKLIGGQSLKGPINALQNAITFNYYGNSTFYNTGIYADATKMETLQYSPNDDPEIALPNDINFDINQSAINPDILLT